MNWNIFFSEELDLIPLNFPTECRPCFIQNLLPFNRELLWVCQVWHAVACWDVKVLAAHSALQRDCIVLWPKFSWNGTKGEKGRREQDTGGVSSLSAALDHVKCQQRKNILVMFTDKCWWQHFQTPNLKKNTPKASQITKVRAEKMRRRDENSSCLCPGPKTHPLCLWVCLSQISLQLMNSSWCEEEKEEEEEISFSFSSHRHDSHRFFFYVTGWNWVESGGLQWGTCTEVRLSGCWRMALRSTVSAEPIRPEGPHAAVQGRNHSLHQRKQTKANI